MSLTATPSTDRIIMYLSQYNDMIAERNALAEQVRELREENERGVLEIDALRGIVSDWLEFCLNPNRGNNQQADPLDRLMILITKSKKATLEALNAMGYGFDIPAGAKITGIVLETRKK